MKRRITAVALALALAFAAVPAAIIYADDIKVTINGVPVEFAEGIVDGRTLVPVRGVFESLGFEVEWRGAANQAVLTRGSDLIIITIGLNRFSSNEWLHDLDVPAQVIDGATMIPIGRVLRSVGYDLEWDEAKRTVVITTGQDAPAPTPELEPVPAPTPEPVPTQTPAPSPTPVAATTVEPIVIVPPGTYRHIGTFSEGLAPAQGNAEDSDDYLYGFIDTSGEVVIPFIYDDVGNFNDGLAATWLDGKCGAIDTTGEVIIPFIYDYLGPFNDGLAVVRQGSWPDELFGFEDATGELVVPLIYDSARDFSDGLAQVRIGSHTDGKWGFVNTVGEVVVPIIYDSVGRFSDGLAPARLDGKWGVINAAGEEVVPFIYDDVILVGEGLVAVVLLDVDDNTWFGLVRIADQ